ncbi:putative 2-oxo-4-hydroxy-4-carboxy-5-ureidoimidazoline decarboxylase [Grammomys surdaster]|uniref:putative 2-oxo-4-hydroxy-4-carboxy-5-ureidoimidazoline decarboxylase n=1 Tax=Grammomys surdaster TaxID=491861 RepID=UPI0010A05E93|nr:putative 2-oxo-4-hydroxy-4-carboxy-5-ureidoimidazoline decarboxylase [Grammomys surdaster]
MDMEKVNSMDFSEFVDVFGNVVEKCPLIAAAVWSQRPFSGLEDLENHFFAFIDALPRSGQEGILRCHPDLAGRDLQQGTLTAESQREQSQAGLTSLDIDDRLRLQRLNAQYRERFGFPFVLAARLSDRATVPRELARRLHCQPESELCTALGEVKKISHLRLTDLLGAHSARVGSQRGWGSERQQDASGRDTLRPTLAQACKDNPYTHTKEVEN